MGQGLVGDLNDIDLKDFTMERFIAEGKEYLNDIDLKDFTMERSIAEGPSVHLPAPVPRSHLHLQ